MIYGILLSFNTPETTTIKRAFSSADGDFLIVPQEGTLLITTEFGKVRILLIFIVRTICYEIYYSIIIFLIFTNITQVILPSSSSHTLSLFLLKLLFLTWNFIFTSLQLLVSLLFPIYFMALRCMCSCLNHIQSYQLSVSCQSIPFYLISNHIISCHIILHYIISKHFIQLQMQVAPCEIAVIQRGIKFSVDFVRAPNSHPDPTQRE